MEKIIQKWKENEMLTALTFDSVTSFILHKLKQKKGCCKVLYISFLINDTDGFFFLELKPTIFIQLVI
jgi:hypothetical protein